ncbi:hypothetical protein [Hymenobacter coccineus]|uniref:Uncharacterized protein n=1 Tax=Hymenobacter coccineus TaxID=1908235 RepID=A0A1G1SVW9_9BACT|nr:hypothetical protein [Hymenobacter coccineus]OGX82766.1 hypothetical protein BEN49_02560 [Hymenobacter coccineus]
MKNFFFLMGLLLLGAAARAQTVPFDPSAPVRGGAQGQTVVPPLNPGLNHSTIQGPAEVQRATTSLDAQPSRLDPESGFGPAATPAGSPAAVPDVREQPIIRQQPRRESTDIVPSRNNRSRSSKTPY